MLGKGGAQLQCGPNEGLCQLYRELWTLEVPPELTYLEDKGRNLYTIHILKDLG